MSLNDSIHTDEDEQENEKVSLVPSIDNIIISEASSSKSKKVGLTDYVLDIYGNKSKIA